MFHSGAHRFHNNYIFMDKDNSLISYMGSLLATAIRISYGCASRMSDKNIGNFLIAFLVLWAHCGTPQWQVPHLRHLHWILASRLSILCQLWALGLQKSPNWTSPANYYHHLVQSERSWAWECDMLLFKFNISAQPGSRYDYGELQNSCSKVKSMTYWHEGINGLNSMSRLVINRYCIVSIVYLMWLAVQSLTIIRG